MPIYVDFTTFSILGQKFVKFFRCCFFGKFKTSKRHSQINWPLAWRTFCSLLWPSNFGRDHFRGRIGPYNRDPAPEWQPSFGIGKVYWASQHPVDWSLYVDQVRKSCSSSLKESLEELLEISLNFRLRDLHMCFNL